MKLIVAFRKFANPLKKGENNVEYNRHKRRDYSLYELCKQNVGKINPFRLNMTALNSKPTAGLQLRRL
jgi:hypothetical protein